LIENEGFVANIRDFLARDVLILRDLVGRKGAIRVCDRGADRRPDECDRSFSYGSTRSVMVSHVELWIKFRRVEMLVLFEVVSPLRGVGKTFGIFFKVYPALPPGA
jgi:hypothetical protein